MPVKTQIKTILFFILLVGCKSIKVDLQDQAFYTLLNTQYKSISKKEIPIFYKTINSNLGDIKDQIRFEKLNFNVTLSGERIVFENLMTQKDLDYLKAQIEGLGKSQIDPQQLDFPVRLIRKKEVPYTYHFSQPFFTRNKEFAFIFRGKASGGDSFIVFQKKEGQWSFLCEVVLSMV